MQKIFNSNIFKFILIALFCLIAIAIFIPYNIAYAQNTDVIIDVNTTSKFDAYNDVFAYTSNNSLYVVKDNNILSLNNAFTGTCRNLLINDTNILILATQAQEAKLYYFSYTQDSISKSQNIGELDAPINGISRFNSDFFISYTFDSFVYYNKFVENKNITDLESFKSLKNDCVFEDFICNTQTNTIYGIKDDKLYYTNTALHIGLTDDKMKCITDLTNLTSITMIGDILYANSSNGIYEINTLLDSYKVVSSSYPSGKISSITIDDESYIMAFFGNSIIQYLITEDGLEYFNKFDNVAYVHPTNFDIVRVAKILSDTKVYSTPKNLQIKQSLSMDDYILILTTVSDISGDFLYIAMKDGLTGYIKQSSSYEYINPNSNIEELTIGLYAQGLHKVTKIYKYPYSTSTVIKNATIYEQLVVIDNVAQEGDNQVWAFYKVSYVENGEIFTGYVKVYDVSPYTSLVAPKTLKPVKVASGALGEAVYLYALPSEDSTQVAMLTDGAELELAEEYNSKQEWTKVVYGDSYAYIKTSQIQPSGLTSLQTTLIVISVIVVVVTITMLLIIIHRRKMGY